MVAAAPVQLISPTETHLPAYIAALQRGWSADNIRGAEAATEELEKIQHDPASFILSKADDRDAKGGPVKLPDGSFVQRLPGIIRWIWDGEFCGSIGLRWQPGTGALPPHVLGHIGYAIVPWKRNRGYATAALALMLNEARAENLPYVDITTDPENPASQKVILSNGGVFIERFEKPLQYGAAAQSLRYRIALTAAV
jgi:predicted acetyltransferase